MTFTVDISLYPLTENYLEVVDRFIRSMKKHTGLKVITQHASTLVIGPSEIVFPALEEEMKRSFETYGKASFNMKVLSGDLTELVDITPYAE